MFPCPCCGYLTMPTRTDYDLCPVCYWEDDRWQAEDETRTGGANGSSLREARATYLRIGAMAPRFLRFVRPPRPDEVPG